MGFIKKVSDYNLVIHDLCKQKLFVTFGFNIPVDYIFKLSVGKNAFS